MDEVTLRNIPAQRVLGIHRKGEFNLITPMMLVIFNYLEDNKIDITAPPIFLWHEKSLNEAEREDARGTADIEVVVPVAERVEDAGEIKCYKLPGATMAAILHRGPYDECRETYERLFAWLDEHSMPVIGPIREVYLNDPSEIPREDLLTQIYAPVG